MTDTRKQYEEALINWTAARTAWINAKTKKAAYEADQDIQFWSGKMAHYGVTCGANL